MQYRTLETFPEAYSENFALCVSASATAAKHHPLWSKAYRRQQPEEVSKTLSLIRPVNALAGSSS